MADNIRQIRTTSDKLGLLLEEPPKKRGVPWFWLMVATVMALGFTAVYFRADIAVAVKPKAGAPEQLSATQVQVIDGSTIRLRDKPGDIRLMGFSTPETVRARCDAERERGYTAMRRLRAIVESTQMELQSMPCACPPGADSCNAGRRCGILRANGWDVGERLIAEGLAVRFSCTAASCPAPATPWCDAR